VEARPWNGRSVVLLALTIFAWGTNYLFVRIGLQSATPLWLAALRAGSAALALGVYFLAVPLRTRLDGTERIIALLIGVPNTAVFLGLWFLAAESVPPGQSAVIIYTFPLWVALLSVPVLRQRLGSLPWLAIALGFAGVLLVSQPWAAGPTRPPFFALLELLGAAISWAIATVVVQRRFAPEAMATVNGYQLLSGAVVLLLLAVAIDPRDLPVESPSLWIAVGWLGVFGTAFAYAVWFDLLGRVPAPTLSAYSFLVPLVALGASATFLGERLDVTQAAGIALVVVSIYGISRAQSRKAMAPRPLRPPPPSEAANSGSSPTGPGSP
jgi:drug/metabolite transporter (DMT)-like permease